MTVSVKVKRELKEEVERRRPEMLEKELEELSEALESIDVERFMKHIREDRENDREVTV